MADRDLHESEVPEPQPQDMDRAREWLDRKGCLTPSTTTPADSHLIASLAAEFSRVRMEERETLLVAFANIHDAIHGPWEKCSCEMARALRIEGGAAAVSGADPGSKAGA